MISEEDALAQIMEKVTALSSMAIPLGDSLNRFAAQDYFARLPLPAFDNSAMDGYALMASSSGKTVRLRVIGEQPAGLDRNLRVRAGEAVRIFTGAPMPQGADAVVMQEDVERDGTTITLAVTVEPGEFVRRRGCDLAQGQVILRRGERIRPATVGLLASQGLADVIVGAKADVTVISTGDELSRPGKELKPGQIYDSNSALLGALLKGFGVRPTAVQHCRDNRESLQAAIKRGIKSDMLIITGGVSVGEHDFVKQVLSELGARIETWRVAVKPGKPFLFGIFATESVRSADETPVRMECDRHNCFIFGLPGNPVSAFVTFLQFVRPALLRMMGAVDVDLPQVPATLGADVAGDGDRPHYVRGKLEHGRFTPVGRQESHALFGLSLANALLRVAVGESLKEGEIVNVQLWGDE
jgi:molybdopterin molybdotransferase